ncbi:MAG: amidase [Solirubrobacteraceae bacterium]|nr:amidase [Solirubrobacteraceae bacterium]
MDASDLAFAGAAEQARLIAAGDVSSRELVQTYLDRIDRLNPQLNAWRVVFAERALAEADQADARRGAGGERPLLGVPIAIKDDIDVAGEPTAWGTSAHAGPVARDADLVSKLRTAGAIVLGKTHVPEMTIWPFTETITFGATRNPWDLDRTPGGSSGGTAAAVASGMVGIGVGSDGAGSIRIPAAWCGLFGIKPQRDRVPLAPHDDAWQGMSVNGPLTRRVADAALFLDATTGENGFAAAAAREPGKLRIAVSTKLAPGQLARVSPDARAAVERTAEMLRSLGHEVTVRDPELPASLFTNVLVRYLRGIHDDVEHAMPHPQRLEPRTRAMARLGGLIPASVVAKQRAAEQAIAARINAIFDHADVLLQPGPVAGPFKVGQFHGRGAMWTLNSVAARVPFQGWWNATGQPACVVPSGLDRDGLPVGVQLVGRPSDEATLLSLSAQLEAERPWADRRPPVS